MNCPECGIDLINTEYGYICSICKSVYINDTHAELLDWKEYEANWLARISKMGFKCEICEEKLATITHEPPIGNPSANRWYCDEHEEILLDKWQKYKLLKED